MVVRKGDRDLGAIGLMDTPREAAKTALRRLHEMGVSRMIMISGDHQKVAEAIANDVGIDEAWGDLMPAHKVAPIKNLAGVDKVALAGYGMTATPDMASHQVGLAMASAASAVGLDTPAVPRLPTDPPNLPISEGLC